MLEPSSSVVEESESVSDLPVIASSLDNLTTVHIGDTEFNFGQLSVADLLYQMVETTGMTPSIESGSGGIAVNVFRPGTSESLPSVLIAERADTEVYKAIRLYFYESNRDTMGLRLPDDVVLVKALNNVLPGITPEALAQYEGYFVDKGWRKDGQVLQGVYSSDSDGTWLIDIYAGEDKSYISWYNTASEEELSAIHSALEGIDE